MSVSGALGKMIHENSLKQKISRDTIPLNRKSYLRIPYNNFRLQRKILGPTKIRNDYEMYWLYWNGLE